MKILLAIDDSPYSESVIDAVVSRSFPRDSQIRVVTVIEPLELDASDGLTMAVLKDIEKARHESARKLLDKCKHRLDAMGADISVHFEVLEGDPRQKIIDAASQWGASKILIGAHSHGLCPRNLVGSVSRAVAAHAPCTVEIVRKKAVHAAAH